MSRDSRRHHPQVIRAKELARAAGLDPYAPFERSDGMRPWPTYYRFMDAAFDEHFEREAVDNIYWNQGGSFYTDRWDIPHSRDGECTFGYGRCRSGRRWFWCVHGWAWGHHKTDEDYLDAHGFADTEEQALIGGTSAIKQLAAGRRVIAHHSHQTASRKLKEVNAEKWKARPASNGKDSKVVEYLYGHTHGGEDSPGSPVRFRITKKTAKRVYYLRAEERIDQHGEPLDLQSYRYTSSDDAVIGYVNRQKLEADGEVRNRGVHWCYSDYHLHASLHGLLDRHRDPEPIEEDLHALKAAMAAAHPDRGGSSAAFIEARQRYVAARRRARAEWAP